MKKIFIFALMFVALSVQGATKVETQHFELADSVRFYEPDDPQSDGYKFSEMVKADWPITINGKKSLALNDFLLEEVFYACQNPNCFPGNVNDVNTLTGCVKNWIDYILHSSAMANEYIVKDYGTPGVKDITFEEDPMRCMYELTDLKQSHVVGDLVFFVEYSEIYYGGVHPDYMYNYYAFDAALDRPIRLDDIITDRSKLLRILPKYDKRDKDVKWWDNINAVDLGNFYIKDGNMVCPFAPYAVGPFCDGEIEVKVPLKTLNAKGLLTTYGKKFLKNNTGNKGKKAKKRK
ncbi:MAG: DUF3298 domain-containing protein [Muribaculaceae bacterium]|nr:DUF3298 domain-containing protein [Muribaculaceae bacterium]